MVSASFFLNIQGYAPHFPIKSTFSTERTPLHLLKSVQSRRLAQLFSDRLLSAARGLGGRVCIVTARM